MKKTRQKLLRVAFHASALALALGIGAGAAHAGFGPAQGGGSGGGASTTTLQQAYTNGAAGGGAVATTLSGGPLAITNPAATAQAALTVTQNTSGQLAGLFSSGSISCPDGGNSERFGAGSAAGGSNSTAFGNAAAAAGIQGVAIGRQAITGTTASNIAIGQGATTSSANSGGSIAIGQTAQSIQGATIAIGQAAIASGNGSTVMGAAASDNAFTGCIVLGYSAAALSTSQFVAGSGNFPIADVYFGQGSRNAVAAAYTIHGTAGFGGGSAGAAINIAGGTSGDAATGGGAINFQVAKAASGTSLSTVWTIANTGQLNNTASASVVQLVVNGPASSEQCYFCGAAGGGTVFSVQGPVITDGIARRLGTFLDTASALAGTGGTFGIGGYANGVTAPTAFAEIGGLKANGSAGDTQGYMVLGTRKANGGAIVEALRIDTSQTILIPSTNVFGFSASSINTLAADLGMSREGAASVDFGNGTPASKTATLNFTSAKLQNGGGLAFRVAAPGTDNVTWGTGGSFAVGATSQLYGPTDAGFFLTAGTPAAGAGNSITITSSNGITNSNGGSIIINAADTGGSGTSGNVTITAGINGPGTTGTAGTFTGQGGLGGATSGAGGPAKIVGGAAGTSGAGGLASVIGGAAVGTDQNAGGATISTGNSRGAGTALINFNAPPVAASGAGANASVLVAKFARSTNTTTTNLNAYSFVSNATGAALNTADQDGFIYVGSCAGTPTGTPTSFTGAAPIAIDSTNNLLYFYTNGSWRSAGAGATPTLGTVVNAGNVVNSVAASGQLTWTTGGTYAAGTTSQLYGPTDTGMFVTAGKPAGSANGQALTLTGGLATTSGTGGASTLAGGDAAGTDKTGGGVNIFTGIGTGAGTGVILFKVSKKDVSGSTPNSLLDLMSMSNTSWTINAAGLAAVGANSAGNISGTAGQSATGNAGTVTWTGGTGGSTSGAGGSFTGAGGAVSTTSASNNAGQANLNGGSCTGTTTTGNGGASSCLGGLGGTTSGTGGAFTGAGGAGQGSASGVGGLATLAGGAGSTGSSNNASGGVLLSTGLSSGNGSSNITARTSFTLGSNSTAQTIGDRMMICGKTLVLSNTSATATAFASLSTTSGSGLGGTCFYTVVVSDGTEWSSASGQFDFSVVNKAGTLTTATPLIQTENIANSTGATLATTGTPTVVASGTAVLLKVTPTFSGTNAAGVSSCKVSWEIVLRGSVSTVTPQ